MSKIINKKELDILIESTIKEWNYNDNPHNMSYGMEEFCSQYHNMDSPECQQYFLNTGNIFGNNEPEEKKPELKEGTMCECGGMMYEGKCNECGTSYMEEGKKEIKNPGKYMGGAKQKAGVDDDGDGVPNGADKDPKDGNVTEASVKDLAESVTKTFDASFLTENMDNFKKLINYRNK